MRDKPSIGSALAIIAFFGAIIIWRYGIAPRRLRKITVPLQSPLIAVALEDWPEEFAEAALLPFRTLAAQGFTAIGHARIATSAVSIADAYASIWSDPANGDVATIHFSPARTLGGKHFIAVDLSLTRSFADKTEFTTAWVDPCNHLPRPPNETIRIVRVGDPVEFIAVHRHWTNLAAGSRDRAPTFENIASYSDAGHRELVRWITGIKYFKLNSSNAAYIPTTRGVYLTAWRRLWPMRQWREMRDRAMGHRAIRAWKKDRAQRLIK